MSTGIDVGARDLHVSTGAGTTRYDNAIRPAEDDADAEAITLDTPDGEYVVGRGPDDTGHALFGDGDDLPTGVRRAAAEAFLGAVADAPALGHVTVGETGVEPLSAVAATMGYEPVAVDPGVAVCYDAQDSPATALGVALADGRAVGTLVVEGVPVATAALAVDDAWFDLDELPETAEGASGTWLARQYETLFGDLADRLARTAPRLGEAVPVVVGGAGAPPADVDGLGDALAALPFEIASVAVADRPAAALARGARAAAEADDGTAPPLPAFAVDVPFVRSLASFEDATAALGVGARRPGTTHTGESDAGDGDIEAALARTRRDLESLDRRGAMAAGGVSDLVARLEDGAPGGGADVAALEADLAEIESRLPDEEALATLEENLADEVSALGDTVASIQADLDRLSAETASAETVADLEAAVERLDEAVDDLERDTDRIRATLTGLEGDEELEAPAVSGEGVDALRAEALQDDIEDLADRLADRVEALWTELDDLSDRLVDVEATAEDVPDLESTVTATRDAVADLESDTASLEDSVAALRSDLEAVREETPAQDDIDDLSAELDGLAGDVRSLRAEVDEADRVEPETVEGIEADMDGLRQTLIARADRLESVEETAESLQERIETVYQTSAKSEALASLETETARIRKTAAQAMERTNEMNETVSRLDETVASHDEQLGMLSTNVDNLAGSAVTRPEMDSAIDKVDDRLADMEADVWAELNALRDHIEGQPAPEPAQPAGPQDLVVLLQAVAFVALGGLGAFLAYDAGLVLIAGGFLVFAVMPAILSWLVS